MSTSPTVFEPESMESLLDNIDEEALLSFANNDIESLLATLEKPYEDMERRIVVSSMVQEAVAKGFLKALEEEAAVKDTEISQLRENLKTKVAAISDMQHKENELLAICAGEDGSSRRREQLWKFMDDSQKKWGESEAAIGEKEKEMAKLAVSMAEMATILDCESKRAAFLDKQLAESREQEAKRALQISTLQQEVERLKLDNSRLKRQARLKELKFNESVELAQNQTEGLLEEKKGWNRALEEKSFAVLDLQNKCWDLETKFNAATEMLNRSLVLQISLEEQMEEEKLMQQVEKDCLWIVLEQQVCRPQTVFAGPFEGQMRNSGYDDDNHIQNLSDDLEGLKSRTDIECMIVQTVVECWFKEVIDALQNMTMELFWKDVYHDREVKSLKQAAEEWENDYATLMSICLALIRDHDPREETAGQLVHEVDYGRRKLIELSGILNAREVVIGGLGDRFNPVLELEEELVGQQLQHEVELEIVLEVCRQKFKEAIGLFIPLHFTLCCEDYVKLESNGEGSVESLKQSTSSLQELEAQIESYMELEACRLERMESGCSTSIAKNEFKLDKLMKKLADQVNERKAKISFVQEAIKQQEWKHNIESEILVSVLVDGLEQVESRLQLDGSVASPKSCICHMDSEYEDHQQNLQFRSCPQNKDKLICFLKRDNEDLRKEKVAIEQKLDERTEELYSLKRHFWKEKEVWMSKLPYPQRKEVESLSRHSSCSLEFEEEFKKLEATRFDSLISKMKDEWQLEKAGFLETINLKEADVEGLVTKLAEKEKSCAKVEAGLFETIHQNNMELERLATELARCTEREKKNVALFETVHQKEMELERFAVEVARLSDKENANSGAKTQLLTRIADLEMENDNRSHELLNQEFLLAKLKQEWQSEKEGLSKELVALAEKEKGHITTEARLLAHVAELESEKEVLTLATLEQNSAFLKSKQEWQAEKERLLEKVLNGEKALEEATLRFSSLSEMEENYKKKVDQLETERSQLAVAGRRKELPGSPSMEGTELALALAIKERDEEEKRRRVLEIQLQGLRVEVKSLQSLNEEVACLKNSLELVPRQLESRFAEQINQFVRASQELEQKAVRMVQDRTTSLDLVKEKCRLLKGHVKAFAGREAHYKQRLAKEASNLQKAETEVDILGDEVDSLLVVLEEVHTAFEMYAPILQYHPRITEVARLVKQEIQLRIDSRYGV